MLMKNKRVIVTGGEKGIGKEIAIAFSRSGAHVIIADMDETTSNGTLEMIRSDFYFTIRSPERSCPEKPPKT